MSQQALPGLAVSARPVCPLCGGKLVMRRCRACQKDTPAPCDTAWKRWVRGLEQTVRSRCEAAGLRHLEAPTWRALMLDDALPPETAPLVADIAALPFSARRYRRNIDRAVLASMLLGAVIDLGVRREADDKRYPVRDVAFLAACRIREEADRRGVPLDEVDARTKGEIVYRAALEHQTRKRLMRTGLRGGELERAVVTTVDRELAAIASHQQQTRRLVAAPLRVETTGPRIDDGVAEDEAAEAEAERKGQAA